MSDCDPDETESVDPNSLIAMPDHIKEDIFNCLELADRKSISENCRTFNKLFSEQKYVDKNCGSQRTHIHFEFRRGISLIRQKG